MLRKGNERCRRLIDIAILNDSGASAFASQLELLRLQ